MQIQWEIHGVRYRNDIRGQLTVLATYEGAFESWQVAYELSTCSSRRAGVLLNP
jgi:hypothetical protein